MKLSVSESATVAAMIVGALRGDMGLVDVTTMADLHNIARKFHDLCGSWPSGYVELVGQERPL